VPGIAKSWRAIEEVLWENAHSVYRALRKPVSDANLARLVELVSARLPPDFVQSLKTHDGLNNSYLGLIRLFDYKALLPVTAVMREYKSLCRSREVPGSQAGADPAIRNDAHWRPGWVPFMDTDGPKLVLDLDPAPAGRAGQVFTWSNTGSTRSRVLAPSFGEWLAGLAEALSKRRFRLDEHGCIWLGGVPNPEPQNGLGSQ
jgi:cell wall assembly regulator SMI1